MFLVRFKKKIKIQKNYNIFYFISGNSFGRYNRTNEIDCFFKCGQNTCGGYSANSIYFAAIGLLYKQNLSHVKRLPNFGLLKF